jgi:hypothetical protein
MKHVQNPYFIRLEDAKKDKKLFFFPIKMSDNAKIKKKVELGLSVIKIQRWGGFSVSCNL